jgi:ribonuclease R
MGSDEGEILAVLEEKNDLVGTARRMNGRLCFVPDDCTAISMQIQRDCEGGAKDGDKVAVEILSRGFRHEDHRVGVAMRFGSADEAKRCAKALLYAQDIHSRFPDKVKEEAKKLEKATVSDEEAAKRLDLRALPIFTIDSAETKDIDDAVSLKETAEGFELGVHIADVSHYVRPGSELDEEAFARGTSVYYADQVVPMLPKQLSNGICSLNEKEVRLAFSCLMRLDKNGELVDYRFVKTVIRSRVKGVYSEINEILAGTAEADITYKYAEVAEQLPAMKRLYDLRAALRKKRGCMDIESGEVKLILDEDGHCINVKKRVQGLSEAMIEEFMLLANQCAAHFARVKQVPFVYRVHEEPNSEKLERLHNLLQACGINDHFAGDVPQPKELSAILDSVRGTPYEKIIHTGMLRCMSKAQYGAEPKGHYGLVLKDYAHFTSPIRRYPDLAIHRILTDMLQGTDKELLALRYADFAQAASKQASEREVIAMQIERKAEDCYKAEYARRHIGERYEGTISGVTQRGVFIELPNGVEGFVPAASLTATGTVLTEGVRLADPVSGKSWSLGDSLMVVIVRADVNLGKIDFEVA